MSIEQCDLESLDRSPDQKRNSSPQLSSDRRFSIRSRETPIVMRPILINRNNYSLSDIKPAIISDDKVEKVVQATPPIFSALTLKPQKVEKVRRQSGITIFSPSLTKLTKSS